MIKSKQKVIDTLERTLNKVEKVETLEQLEIMISKVSKAQKIYSKYSQEQIDKIFKAAATAADKARIKLAKLAVEETQMGIFEDKVIKNHFVSEYVYNKYKSAKTCGFIGENKENGIKIFAEPLGILAGIVPTTNPTSTAIFKSLIALKTRNAIIFSPHPRAKKATIEAAKIVLEAAIKAGAPENIISWIDTPSIELSNALMKHPLVDCILATGGFGMVKAAYSSGKPALGVGAGNAPAIIDETAEIKMAVSSILLSKTFDNGMICASEQSIIVASEIYEEVKKEFIYRGAYILAEDETQKVAKIILTKKGGVNPQIVGQSAYKIAQMAGVEVPKNAKVLIGEQDEVKSESPFAHEKLSPILGIYKARNFETAIEMAYSLVMLGGAGHTAALFTDERKRERIDYFSQKIPACRLLINSPSSQGGIGDIYNFRLVPSLTLGCGSWGGNSVSENVGIKHLLKYKTVKQEYEKLL